MWFGHNFPLLAIFQVIFYYSVNLSPCNHIENTQNHLKSLIASSHELVFLAFLSQGDWHLDSIIFVFISSAFKDASSFNIFTTNSNSKSQINHMDVI